MTLVASAPAHSAFHQGTARHMQVSADLAKSFLSLEEDVLTAGVGQYLKYWSVESLQFNGGRCKSLRTRMLRGCVRHAGCPTRVRRSSRVPKFFQVPYIQYQYQLSVIGIALGTSAPRATGHKPQASMVNKIMSVRCQPLEGTKGRPTYELRMVP